MNPSTEPVCHLDSLLRRAVPVWVRLLELPVGLTLSLRSMLEVPLLHLRRPVTLRRRHQATSRHLLHPALRTRLPGCSEDD